MLWLDKPGCNIDELASDCNMAWQVMEAYRKLQDDPTYMDSLPMLAAADGSAKITTLGLPVRVDH